MDHPTEQEQKEYFEVTFAKNSGMALEQFREDFDVVRCVSCTPSCGNWELVPKYKEE